MKIMELNIKEYEELVKRGLVEEEEKEIPNKLATWYSVETKQNEEENVEFANYNFETMYEKINEIIDYLEKKRR